jgi:hypothetical protein
MAELVKFRKVGDELVKVEIWGDFIDDCGVMDVDDMMPFLRALKFIATTPGEVIQELREGKDLDRYIGTRKHRS